MRVFGFALALLVCLAGVADAALSVSPSTQAFGDRVVNGTTYTIAESVSGTGTLDHFVVTGTGCSAVTVIPTPPSTLPAIIVGGSPLDITIQFKPVVRGALSCNVDMQDALNVSQGTFTVTGNGIAPEVGVAASTSFGNVRVTN